ncbi:MAG: hypothetical protein EPN36_13555 [Rhodanobacteraceae bacterium]|nr:MAG: hypothetical protein EPN36_13555 [Rhodanobacteraceae bacterium]
MKILFAVDQRAALLAGIDAPSSTITLDIDPAKLGEDERAVLAAVLVGGHDATQVGILADPSAIKAPKYTLDKRGRATPAVVDRTALSFPACGPLQLKRPSAEGMHEAIAEMLEWRRQAFAELQARDDKRVDDAIGRASYTSSFVGLDESGEVVPYASIFRTDSDWSCIGRVHQHEVPTMPQAPYATEAAKLRYEAAVRQVKADNQRATEEEIERLKKYEYPEAIKKRDANVAAAAERAALYRRLPKALRDRHEAGFAADDEVNEALADVILKDAGYKDLQPRPTRVAAATTMGDAEFKRFTALQRAAASAQGTHIEAVAVEGQNGRISGVCARVKIERAGLVATGYLSLAGG